MTSEALVDECVGDPVAMIRGREDISLCVEFEDHRYATLDSTPFSTPYTHSVRFQDEFVQIPIGWELAPDEPSIAKHVIGAHPWGALSLFVQGDVLYFTSVARLVVPPPGVPGERRTAVGEVICRTGTSLVPRAFFGSANAVGTRILIRSPLMRKRPRCEHSTLLAGMWKEKQFTDLVIVCADLEIRCHRAVVARASPVFDRMLNSDMIEARTEKIEIKDAEPSSLSAMVEYFYTAILVEECDIVALLTLADRFQVDVLVETCAAEALRHLVCENVVAVVRAFRPLAPRPETRVLWRTLCDQIAGDPKLQSVALLGV